MRQRHEVYFTQSCPVCGRRLRVAVELLGKQAECSHCSATISIVDPTHCARGNRKPRRPSMERVDRLLASSIGE